MYTITFTPTENIDDLCFKSITSFLDWVFDNKEKLNSEFTFISKTDVDIHEVEVLMTFIKYYLKVKKLCDNEMDEYNKHLLNVNKNDDLKKAYFELTRANQGGKYLRGMLVALGYNSSNNEDNKYLDLALAIELFQTSILIHDDIIDNAVVRRGMDTIPVSYNKSFNINNLDKKKEFGNSMAICIGDLGFYLADELIINGYKQHPNLIDILSYYHNMAIKTCEGEMIDISLPFKERYVKNDENVEEKIMDIYRLKTAWYSVIGPFCLGLMLGSVNKEKIKEMEEILLNVGIAFQIKDDLLGIYGDNKQLGKSTNSDIEEFKQTLLYSYVKQTPFKEEFLKSYGQNNLKDIEKVKNIFEKSGARKYATDKMNELFNQSIDNLNKVEWIDLKYKNILKGFIIYLKNRTK